MWKLFIDDERDPVTDDYVVARSSLEAFKYVLNNGYPNFISFDHDLGGVDTSMIFLQLLIEYDMDHGGNNFPSDFDYYVHSQNPIGKKNIEGYLDGYLKVNYNVT